MSRVKDRKTRFVLISIQRSGSTLLTDYLASHHDIYMAKELFKMSGEGLNVDADGYRYSELPISEYLDDFYKLKGRGYDACGFKIMLDQLEKYPEIIDYVKQHNIFCLYLERRNILKTYISRISARGGKLYHTEKDIAVNPVFLQADVIENNLDTIKLTLEKIHYLIQNMHSQTVYYEDLVKNPLVTLEKVQVFLCVKKQKKLISKLKKINIDDLNKTISNYKEIYLKLITNNDYAKYLIPVKND